jgi:hypothetical protein
MDFIALLVLNSSFIIWLNFIIGGEDQYIHGENPRPVASRVPDIKYIVLLPEINSKTSKLCRIYLCWFLVKNTSDTEKSASYLDRNIENYNVKRLKTKLYDKRDDFSFPFTSSNIPASLAYRVYISQLVRYPRACAQPVQWFYWQTSGVDTKTAKTRLHCT